MQRLHLLLDLSFSHHPTRYKPWENEHAVIRGCSNAGALGSIHFAVFMLHSVGDCQHIKRFDWHTKSINSDWLSFHCFPNATRSQPLRNPWYILSSSRPVSVVIHDRREDFHDCLHCQYIKVNYATQITIMPSLHFDDVHMDVICSLACP